MDRPLIATPAAALALAGAVVIGALIAASYGSRDAPAARRAADPAQLGANGREVLGRCSHSVMIIHDVHWAAACDVTARELELKHAACRRAADSGEAPPACAFMEPPDDSTDCSLPPGRAYTLNNARAAAENQCFDEAAAAERVAGGAAR